MTPDAELKTAGGLGALRGAKQIKLLLDRFEVDTAWLEANRASLLREYGRCFVAVLDQTVAASSGSLRLLIESLETKGIDPAAVVAQYVTDEELDFIV